MNIKNIIESGYNYIGIRWMTSDESYSVGDACRNSFDWDYENDISSFKTENPVELDGTCAIKTDIDLYFDEPEEIEEKIKNAIDNHSYCGSIIVIGGNRAENGADFDEIIISDAVVIDVM